MSEVPIQISGVLYDKIARSQQSVTLVGYASIVGLSVGGGPIVPPEEIKPPGEPPTIWPGPGDPDFPGDGKPDLPPPSIWPPGPGIDWPEHPIVIPPPVDGEKPPIEPGTIIDWKPVWTPDRGWFVVGIPQVPHPAPSK